jgi:hypothetical protein
MVKRCPKCKQEKDTEEFYSDSSKKSGLSSYCKICQIARSAHRWVTLKDQLSLERKAYYQANKEKYLSYARSLREEVLDAYGGKCACCGETTREFLGVDHINNDGESHRREVLKGYGRSIYRWLKQSGYPNSGFQLLCHNCNISKGLYGGCPHRGPVPGKRQRTTRWNRNAHP